jgi:hypothetical protein
MPLISVVASPVFMSISMTISMLSAPVRVGYRFLFEPVLRADRAPFRDQLRKLFVTYWKTTRKLPLKKIFEAAAAEFLT